MSDLDRVIQVNTIAQTKAVAESNYGMPLLTGYHTHFPERSRKYTSLDGMVDDGFETTGPKSSLYRMASMLLGQDPQIAEFKIGRCALPSTSVTRLVATSVVVGTRYRFRYNGSLISYTVIGGDDATDVATEFKTQIDLLSLAVTATVATGGLTLTNTVAGDLYTLSIESDATHGALSVDVTNVDPGIATDLAAINSEDKAWYSLQLVSSSKAEIAAAGAWAQANKKRYIACTAETACRSSGSTTDVLSAIETSGYSRVAGMFHSTVNGYAAAAWEGKMLPLQPGSYTGKFKTLAGVTIDKFTEAELATIEDKHGNCYTSLGGNGSTEQGWAGDGTFLDQMRFLDWLEEQVQIEMALPLLNLLKVGMTDAGITTLESAFRVAITRGVDVGGIDGERVIKYTIPKIAAVPQNQRTLRNLPGFKAEFFLQGAIHSAKPVTIIAKT